MRLADLKNEAILFGPFSRANARKSNYDSKWTSCSCELPSIGLGKKGRGVAANRETTSEPKSASAYGRFKQKCSSAVQDLFIVLLIGADEFLVEAYIPIDKMNCYYLGFTSKTKKIRS